MPTFEKGDIVRVPFPYTDRATRQHRPAVIVSSGTIGEAGSLLWVAMITSAANRSWPGDLLLDHGNPETGLPAASVIRPCKLATIEARHDERLGRVAPETLAKLQDSLVVLFGFP